MDLRISPETFQTLIFALNIAENTCAPGNKEKIMKLQDTILSAKCKWEDDNLIK